MHTVTLSADNNLQITVMLDAPSPQLTGGFGGWDVVARPKRVSMTRYAGSDPVTQDIAVMFDGYSNDESQEDDISTLMNMALPVSELQEPPKIRLSGVAHRKDLSWIISGIDFDNQDVMWIMKGSTPVRVRQKAVIHLTQYVDDKVIITQTSPAIANAKPKNVVTTPKGMTLKQIAAIEYGDPDLYMSIFLSNRWLDPDPRKIIPAGIKLTIPQRKNGTTTVGTKQFTVP